MERLSHAWGKVLEAFALAACALLGLMALMICADVLLRNVELIPGVDGLPWSNELSETTLYVVTMLAAPWLLREGRHIRVDIVLRAIPARAGWICEWLCDAIALACCVCVVIYATRAAWDSYSQGSITIKTLVLPEWWTLAPLPVAFLLLSVEVLFRMRRLWLGPRAPREDAVSSS
ncbi:MAG TPA: TRAP transporter small permease [Burkholderiales bacterium]|nr:TRAP transporter small permease [Burkholderiales bacterium]